MSMSTSNSTSNSTYNSASTSSEDEMDLQADSLAEAIWFGFQDTSLAVAQDGLNFLHRTADIISQELAFAFSPSQDDDDLSYDPTEYRNRRKNGTSLSTTGSSTRQEASTKHTKKSKKVKNRPTPEKKVKKATATPEPSADVSNQAQIEVVKDSMIGSFADELLSVLDEAHEDSHTIFRPRPNTGAKDDSQRFEYLGRRAKNAAAAAAAADGAKKQVYMDQTAVGRKSLADSKRLPVDPVEQRDEGVHEPDIRGEIQDIQVIVAKLAKQALDRKKQRDAIQSKSDAQSTAGSHRAMEIKSLLQRLDWLSKKHSELKASQTETVTEETRTPPTTRNATPPNVRSLVSRIESKGPQMTKQGKVVGRSKAPVAEEYVPQHSHAKTKRRQATATAPVVRGSAMGEEVRDEVCPARGGEPAGELFDLSVYEETGVVRRRPLEA